MNQNKRIIRNHLLCLLTSLLFLPALAGCTGFVLGTHLRPLQEYTSYIIRPVSDESDTDLQWASYLYSHMANRTIGGIISYDKQPDHEGPFLTVEVSMNPELDCDYEIAVCNDLVRLTGKRKANMLWLVYQFVARAGVDDKRIDVDDLQPAMIRLENKRGNFTFEYRGIYTLSNENTDMMQMIGSQNVDSDWGIWGHNLWKIFTFYGRNKGIPEEAQALVNGQRTPEQLCLTSERLYEATTQYVIKRYGDTPDDFARFLIMPMDNELVCQCPTCKAAGNTPDNCQPALTQLVNRLADRFPCHQFFLGAYSTHTTIPDCKLRPNVGVFISAINFPMGCPLSKATSFVRLVEEWKTVTSLIYVWDYTNNFDDYLTPYPNLRIMADRLRWYRDMGVRGVFVNGSGPIYSSHNYMQTFVLASLLIDPDLDANELIETFMHQYYPKTAEILLKRYQLLEQQAYESSRPLPFYGGVTESNRVVEAQKDLAAFFYTLDEAAKQTSGLERFHLNRTLTGLCYAVLEQARLSKKMYERDSVADLLATLSNYKTFPQLTEYREADGSIDCYLEQWEQLRRVGHRYRDNKLQQLDLHAFTPLDEDYPRIKTLNDGLCGFPTNYHDNWLIVSAPTLDVELPAGTASLGRTLTVSTFHRHRWHINQPARIELLQDGRVVATAVPHADAEMTRTLTPLSLAGLNARKPATLRLTNPTGTMAIDELIVE